MVSDRQHLICNFYLAITIKLFPVVPMTKQLHLTQNTAKRKHSAHQNKKSKQTLKKEQKMRLQ